MPRLPADPNLEQLETVRTLLDAGAATDEIDLSSDDPKPASPEVSALLRARIDHQSDR